MLELSMHILDIAQNSLRAGASRVEIRIREDLAGDRLEIEIEDNGRGISPEMLPRVTDPFVTSRTTRPVGLGLPLLKEAAERTGGGMEIHSRVGFGTKVRASFQLDHFDRAPLGDMGETLSMLIAGNPRVDFLYEHRVDSQVYTLDTREMRKVLGTDQLDDPIVADFVREDIHNGLKAMGAATFPKIKQMLK